VDILDGVETGSEGERGVAIGSDDVLAFGGSSRQRRGRGTGIAPERLAAGVEMAFTVLYLLVTAEGSSDF
jgi:hypothetical protein